jgi:hypothetical protein
MQRNNCITRNLRWSIEYHNNGYLIGKAGGDEIARTRIIENLFAM